MSDSLYSTADFRAISTTTDAVFQPADMPRAIRIGGAGDLHLVRMKDGVTVVIPGCVAGEVVEARPLKVLASTTATGLVGYW